jgi:hypothetical protein
MQISSQELHFKITFDDICILLGYYATSSGKLLKTFREKYLSHFQGSRVLCNTPEECRYHQNCGGSLK